MDRLCYAEISNQVQELASGLIARGMNKGDRIVLALENSQEWVIADLAIMAIGAVTVPAFTSNTEDDHLHILTIAVLSPSSLPRARLLIKSNVPQNGLKLAD